MKGGGGDNGSICSWEMGLENGNYTTALAALYLLAIVVLFIAIAIVCDDYFVPSLEVICKRLRLSEDVAGATFMAAGSSAPELFTSLAAVTNSSDIGVGTIVGSAVFNILIIISLSAVVSKGVLILDWRPLTRDALFYGVSIVLFSVFAWDGRFTLVESIVTLSYYFIYIITLKFNPYLFLLMDLIKSCCKCMCRSDPHIEPNNNITHKDDREVSESGPVVHVTPPTDSAHSELPGAVCMKGLGVPTSMMRTHSSGSSGIGSMTDDPPQPELVDKVWLPRSDSLESVEMEAPKSAGAAAVPDWKKSGTVPMAFPPVESLEDHPQATGNSQEHAEEEEGMGEDEGEQDWDEVAVCCCDACPAVMTSLPTKPSGVCSGLRYAVNVAYFLTAFPFQLLFSFTIPNCLKPRLKRFYLLSFTGSVIWIALLSYAMVLLVEKFGCILGFNNYVMGLVVVAAGTSVPDALSSVIVAREGHGDMAVSNALGSNVFDINLGLGLPFIIKIIYQNSDLILVRDIEKFEDVPVKPHAKFGLILLGILCCVYTLLAFGRFRLSRLAGLSFIVLYGLFIAYALVQELVCGGGVHC